MPLKPAIAAAALAAMLLSGTPWAQTAADEAAAHAEMRRKIDEATAADDKFHAERTEANMIARDRAEAEAAAAIRKSHDAMDKAGAEDQGGAPAPSPR